MTYTCPCGCGQVVADASNLYSTFSVDGSKFAQALNSIITKEVEGTTEVKAKRREWFDNLPEWDKMVLAVALIGNTRAWSSFSRTEDGIVTGFSEYPDQLNEYDWSNAEKQMTYPSNHVQAMGIKIPNLRKKAKYPDNPCLSCGLALVGSDDAISRIVIHLNDGHSWSFNQIADWLDTLDVDLSFPIPE